MFVKRKRLVFLVSMVIMLTMLSGCLGGESGVKYELKIDVSGNGSVVPSTGKYAYTKGTSVTLVATPGPEWEFSYWIGDVLDPYSPETEILVDTEKSVTAVFYNEAESVRIPVQDLSGEGISGISFRVTDGSDDVQTNSKGFAILNTSASSVIVEPYLQGHSFEPKAAIVEKGENIDFTIYPEPYPNELKYELTFNPVEFSNADGEKLNPFSSPKIREAMNRLIDRNRAADIFGGTSIPILTFISPDTFDYDFMSEVLSDLDAHYTYDKEIARDIIKEEMILLGAEMVDNKWVYKGEEVELVFLIRTEDKRNELGEYIAEELESIGFSVEKRFLTGAEASPIWMMGDPRDGLWHLYTGSWGGSGQRGLQGRLLSQFYTPLDMKNPLWEAYEPNEELLDAARKLKDEKFDSVSERRDVFEKGLRQALETSVRIWLFSVQ